MTPLQNLEFTYDSLVKKYQDFESQGIKTSKKQRAEICKQQIRIDETRLGLAMPLRWFSLDELESFGDPDKWPTKPREPLILQHLPEDTVATYNLPKDVRFMGCKTLTVDVVLEELTKMRNTLGGQAPVMILNDDFEDGIKEIRLMDGGAIALYSEDT